jgi:hypothetical protein
MWFVMESLIITIRGTLAIGETSSAVSSLPSVLAVPALEPRSPTVTLSHHPREPDLDGGAPQPASER